MTQCDTRHRYLNETHTQQKTYMDRDGRPTSRMIAALRKQNAVKRKEAFTLKRVQLREAFLRRQGEDDDDDDDDDDEEDEEEEDEEGSDPWSGWSYPPGMEVFIAPGRHPQTGKKKMLTRQRQLSITAASTVHRSAQKEQTQAAPQQEREKRVRVREREPPLLSFDGSLVSPKSSSRQLRTGMLGTLNEEHMAEVARQAAAATPAKVISRRPQRPQLAINTGVVDIVPVRADRRSVARQTYKCALKHVRDGDHTQILKCITDAVGALHPTIPPNLKHLYDVMAAAAAEAAEAAAEAAEARRVEHQADRNAARLADLLKRHE